MTNKILKAIAKKLGTTLLTAMLTLGIFFTFTYVLANAQVDCATLLTEPDCVAEEACQWDVTCIDAPIDLTLEEPTVVQMVEVDADASLEEGWEPSILQTYGAKFLVRGKEALSWSLNIEETGFHDESIQTSYNKVLTIVNSLFILGLLAIAAMWMFSIIIPRRYLKQVIIVYAAAVIFVNFAMPLNRLFIDGTNLLQKTFLTTDAGTIAITDIVETPLYEEVIGYQDTNEDIEVSEEMGMGITTIDPAETEIAIGNFVTGEQTVTGTMTDGNVTQDIEIIIPESEGNSIVLSANESLTISKQSTFKPYGEQMIFSFLLITATGLAYFILALIFVLRIVILWALLILSPILFLLAIFRITRGWFWNWLSIYGRWLLIGPLAALGIAIIINIWQSVGIPISSTYEEGSFSALSNIYFYLPGSDTPNTLSSTSQMMEYLVFLMMLYLPIFFAFALTRQKMISSAVSAVAERIGRKEVRVPQVQREESEREEIEKPTGFVEGVKSFVGSKLGAFAETAIPTEMRIGQEEATGPIPSAASFLPQQLALTSTHDMLGLIGVTKESRQSRSETMEKMAKPELIGDVREREKISAVRSEIENRASQGDPEAMVVMNEIRSKEETTETTTGPTTGPPVVGETHVGIEVEAPEIRETGPIVEHVVKEKEIEKETVIIEKPINDKEDVRTRDLASEEEETEEKPEEPEEPEEPETEPTEEDEDNETNKTT
ncbi:type IV secretion system protein [Patescibacteria group bacterium]|nr:type IV secretion system protein [Patescibacteria group bacterium]MBU1682843.1 type IV secretion system protein [Patescibacteria group bacterium]MBU1934932.1 type IV secretion system protein [Patescibacteria group bacterium]